LRQYNSTPLLLILVLLLLLLILVLLLLLILVLLLLLILVLLLPVLLAAAQREVRPPTERFTQELWFDGPLDLKEGP